MYTVKISTRERDAAAWMPEQTRGGEGISKCGKYRFVINGELEEADFWVVRGKGIKRKETCRVAPENTILMLSEPRGIVNYPKRYRDQFGVLYSCQPEIRHRNKHRSHAILPWFIGKVEQNGRTACTRSYDMLRHGPAPEKTKTLSVITSDKAFTRGHQDRIAFVEKLKEHYGDAVDVFGQGYRGFADKWDVLAPYKYHIAIENTSTEDYWTEKLADCFLAGTYPIYYGCTNVRESFPENGYSVIDIRDFDAAVREIDRVMAAGEFEARQTELQQCRERVLEEYNMFDFIASCCDKLDPSLPKREVTFRPAVTALDWHNLRLYLFGQNYYKMKQALRNRFGRKSVLQKESGEAAGKPL